MPSANKLMVTTPTDRETVMTRTFNAPRHLVFEALTRPELLKRWMFPPPGWEMTRCDEDPRVGGKFRWEWAGPDGKTAMVMCGGYREVIPPERIVRTEAFEVDGQALGEQFVTMELREHDGQTTLTLHVLFPSKEARDGMLASGMEHGVATGYDQLEKMLQTSAGR